jgi:hypothetical protein
LNRGTVDSVVEETEMTRSKYQEALAIYHYVHGADGRSIICTVSVTVDLQCLFVLGTSTGLILLAVDLEGDTIVVGATKHVDVTSALFNLGQCPWRD